MAVITGQNGAGGPPKNNRVHGNIILDDSRDIFWDGAGTGNVLESNVCQTSNPASICH